MRFEFTPAMIAALRSGADLSFGSDHPAYPHQVIVAPATRKALLQDFD
jgi:predicted amidohydrolase YtcJ